MSNRRNYTKLKDLINVLSKNKASDKDAEEHRNIEENNKRIMEKKNKEEYKLDKDLYNKVLKRTNQGTNIKKQSSGT